MEIINLKDLIGKHILTGVDLWNKKVKESYGDYYEDCECVSFVLDGVTYTAIEDPEDGYRSCMSEIGISKNDVVKNIFPPVEVLVREMSDDDYEENEAIEFIDTQNGKIILTVGTKNINDYYPYFVSEFVPENMSINSKSK